MTVIDMLYSILIQPLQLFFEFLYKITNTVIDNPGLSIIVLSLTMNFLVLPLYRRADAMQEEERDIETKLRKGVTHIKKTFKGDERMMILNTYYRQNHYKPTHVLKGSISLFLEIPFFIAAYRFLSHLDILQGVSFGVIRDLGTADQLLSIGGISINVLPIIMTTVNLVSCIIFTKGYPLKTKIQLYAMALFFFVFLYESPAGLVFYWTLNNIFALVKTIFYKLKNPRRIIYSIFAIVGIILFIYGSFFYKTDHLKRVFFIAALGIAFTIPYFTVILKKHIHIRIKSLELKSNRSVFITGALFLVVLLGAVIPSAVIQASPQEFVDVYHYLNPIWYICNSMCLAIGTFLVWMGVFYWLTDQKHKVYFDILVWIGCGITTVNYMFFGKDLGTLSNTLKFEKNLSFTIQQQLVNLLILATVAIILVMIFKYGTKWVPQVLVAGTLALTAMSVNSVLHIHSSVAQMNKAVVKAQEDTPSFTLSKEGKNVVVLMMDRAMNEYIPYIMNEKPALKESFSGFIYYSNTISHGAFTNFGTPALFGGYEYTPLEMNKRNQEPLIKKHNEALKVMPVLFDEKGYEVTVCDPPYANYQWVPDLSIYNDYSNIKTYITNGRFADEEAKKSVIVNNKRNFFCYSVMKALPISIQPVIYNRGNYHHNAKDEVLEEQTLINNFVANGTNKVFQNAYSTLENLSNMTKIKSNSKNNFLMMANDATHSETLLQEPDYVPAEHVDNTEYEKNNRDRYTVNGVTLKMEEEIQYKHYQINMASMIQIGKWLDYLKENDVYDNTRIIITSDHGRGTKQLDNMQIEGQEHGFYNVEFYYPLLMVKDFDAKTFKTSEEFMTNGDVPTLATDGLIKDAKNPFTGKLLKNKDAKKEQYVLGSSQYRVDINNGNTFFPGIWFSVKDDMRKIENWKVVNENATLPTEGKN